MADAVYATEEVEIPVDEDDDFDYAEVPVEPNVIEDGVSAPLVCLPLGQACALVLLSSLASVLCLAWLPPFCVKMAMMLVRCHRPVGILSGS